jgi:hypothetical protein
MSFHELRSGFVLAEFKKPFPMIILDGLARVASLDANGSSVKIVTTIRPEELRWK